MQPSTDSEILTVEEVARLLRTSEWPIRRALNSGALPGLYLGTREGWRIARSDALAWRTNVVAVQHTASEGGAQ